MFEKIFSILAVSMIFFFLTLSFKLLNGWQPFYKKYNIKVVGLYEACALEKGFTKVERDIYGRRIVVCVIPKQ